MGVGVHDPVTVMVGRRPVVTMVGPRRLHGALAAAMDASSPKRRLARGVVRAFAATRTTAFLGNRLTPALSREVELLLGIGRNAAAAAGATCGAVSVAWPAGSRADRRYVLVVDPDGRPVAFTKVVPRDGSQSEALHHEAELLSEFARRPLANWRTPAVIEVADLAEVTVLSVEALPVGSRHIAWSEISGLLPLAAVGAEAAPPSGGEPPLVADLPTSGLRGWAGPQGRLGVVNGDVRASNAFVAGAERWMLDWEFGSLAGPIGADPVGGLLTSWDPLPTDRDTLVARRDQLVEAAATGGLDRGELAAALCFLERRGHAWALPMLDLPAPPTPGET